MSERNTHEVQKRGNLTNDDGDDDDDDDDDNNNNNNNNQNYQSEVITQFNSSIIYYLCAESTAARPITDTAQCRYWQLH
jgi:hypothetical protein